MEANEIWNKAKEELQNTVSTYHFLIEPVQATAFDGNILTLITPHALSSEVIKSNHNAAILEALKNACGSNIGYVISYDSEFGNNYKKELKKELQKQKYSADVDSNNDTNIIDNLAQMQSSANLNLKYKFSNFVVGENNRMAHAVAMTVAQSPAKKYNPFFIYGASGLGKTHLMQAIGHYIIFNKPKLKVKYIKTEQYVNELIENLHLGSDRNQRMHKFRQKYRNVDVLLIDDIQFIESKTGTMEELFHTFDSLYNSNKQIVITSDRLPKDIPTLPARLRTRFEMGIVVDITPPDFETRVAILKNLASASDINLDFDVLEYIAKNYVNNVRELEGAFNKVTAYAVFENKPLTLEFVKDVLKCDENIQKISIEKIVKETAKYFDVSVNDILSTARNQKIANARQIAIYIARELTEQSFESIADFLKKKHTTMLYSYDKVKTELKTNNDMAKMVEDIIRNVKTK